MLGTPGSRAACGGEHQTSQHPFGVQCAGAVCRSVLWLPDHALGPVLREGQHLVLWPWGEEGGLAAR